jgi:hypothetical protein
VQADLNMADALDLQSFRLRQELDPVPMAEVHRIEPGRSPEPGIARGFSGFDPAEERPERLIQAA